jgi:hypothetical protein
MKGKILLSLFALPFFGTGVWMTWSIGSTFFDAYRMQNWIPVEAQLSAGGYETHSGDDSNTYEAFAEYAYRYDGRLFDFSVRVWRCRTWVVDLCLANAERKRQN